MAMDLDRLDAEPYQSIEFEELDDYADEHEFDMSYRNDVSLMAEDIWVDSAPTEHFSIEAGYFN